MMRPTGVTLLLLMVAAPETASAEARVTVDIAAAPDLRLWAERARQIGALWYPVIQDLLPGPGPAGPVRIVLEPELGVPAYALPDRAEIHVSAAFVRSRIAQGTDDFGMVIHELTHTLQRYPRSVRWLTEGIADYIRYERYEPTVPRRAFDLAKARYDEGYWVSSGFLAWIERSYDRNLIRKLHRALSAGTYRESAFFRQATARDLSGLWKDFVASSRAQAAPPRPPSRPSPAWPGDHEDPPLSGALAAASNLGKPLVLNLGTEWCDRCRELDASLSRPSAGEALAGVHLVRYDIEDEPGKTVARRLGVKSLPTLIALDAQGGELDRHAAPEGAARDPEVWLKDVPLLGATGLEACLTGADARPENRAWQLVAARRLLGAGRGSEARRFLTRAATGEDPLAAQALAMLVAVDAQAGDRAGVRQHAQRLLEGHARTAEGLKAFRLLALSTDPPRALLASAASRRLEAPAEDPEEITDLLLHALRAGAVESAGQAAARLSPWAAQDPRRFWFMAEAAHQQGVTARARALVGKAQAFAGSRMRRLMDQDLVRYRRQDRRPSRLLAALGAAEGPPGDPFPPPWSAALARLRSETLGKPDLDLGLVGRWGFEEIGQTPAADGSGLGHTGALINFTAADRQAGRRGRALAYQPARRTVVLIGDSDELDPRDELTVAAWVKAVDWKGNRRVLQKGLGDSQYRLTAEDGKLRFEVVVEARGGGTRRLTASAPLPPEDEWVHLAGTYDGARLRLLVNGAEVEAAPADGARIQITRDPLVIGGKRPSDSTSSNGFHGLIDEVVLYDRALADRELRQLAQPGGPRVSIDLGR
jgi:hypothetical protein